MSDIDALRERVRAGERRIEEYRTAIAREEEEVEAARAEYARLAAAPAPAPASDATVGAMPLNMDPVAAEMLLAEFVRLDALAAHWRLVGDAEGDSTNEFLYQLIGELRTPAEVAEHMRIDLGAVSPGGELELSVHRVDVAGLALEMRVRLRAFADAMLVFDARLDAIAYEGDATAKYSVFDVLLALRTERRALMRVRVHAETNGVEPEAAADVPFRRGDRCVWRPTEAEWRELREAYADSDVGSMHLLHVSARCAVRGTVVATREFVAQPQCLLRLDETRGARIWVHADDHLSVADANTPLPLCACLASAPRGHLGARPGTLIAALADARDAPAPAAPAAPCTKKRAAAAVLLERAPPEPTQELTLAAPPPLKRRFDPELSPLRLLNGRDNHSAFRRKTVHCSVCGLPNTNASSHRKPNHGYSVEMSRAHRKIWFESLSRGGEPFAHLITFE